MCFTINNNNTASLFNVPYLFHVLQNVAAPAARSVIPYREICVTTNLPKWRLKHDYEPVAVLYANLGVLCTVYDNIKQDKMAMFSQSFSVCNIVIKKLDFLTGLD